jgi:two-component system NtrC family response regulator
MVEQALKKYSGKISSAAAELGVSRPTLYELMEKLGLGKGEKVPRGASEDGAEEKAEP